MKCCICGHHISNHLEEDKWWRCHSLGPDFYQCECRLLKVLGRKPEEYDIKTRANEYAKEEGWI